MCLSWEVKAGTILIESTRNLSECLDGDYDNVTTRFADGVLFYLQIEKKGGTDLMKRLKATIPDLKLVKSDKNYKIDYYESKDFKIENSFDDLNTPAIQKVSIESKQVARNAVQYMKAHGYPKIDRFVFNKTTKKSLRKFFQDGGFFQTPLDASLNTYRGPKDINLFGALPFGEDGTELIVIFNKHDVVEGIRLVPAYQGVPAMTVSEFARKTQNVLMYEGSSDSLLFSLPVQPGTKPPKYVDHNFYHKAYSPDKTKSFALLVVTVHVIEGSNVIDSITIKNPYFDRF